MVNRNSTVMWFKLLILVHIGTAFPLKCPEPSQWARRANCHCADPSKYFCLKNDLINGYSENCTRSDFQQAGRKAVLRGGIDADVCSAERYQPYTITFYTNVSTNCIFLKSFCNAEGQIVYDHGNRNTDTTCRCDYRRGYDFLVKPKNPCFCKPSQEDCSCFFKTCSNTSHILSPDYQCIFITDVNLVTQCLPITNEKDLSRRRPQILGNTPMKQNVSVPVKWNNCAALCLVFMCGLCTVTVLVVFFKTEVHRLICRICCRVYYIDDDSNGNITLYEGEKFWLRYQTFRRQRNVVIFKSGTVVSNKGELNITHVQIKDGGLYYAECYGVRSKCTVLTVLHFDIRSPEPQINLIEGQSLTLKYILPIEVLFLHFFKNNKELVETERIRKLCEGTSYTLTIENLTSRDNGHYSVGVQHYGHSEVTQLKVKRFHIESPGSEIHVIEGDNVTLRYTLPTEGLQLHFYKNKKFIVETESITKHSEDRLNSLTIRNVTTRDQGLYFAKVKTYRSEVTKLKVQSMFTSEFNQTCCIEGGILELKCSVYSENIEVKWLKNDIEIIQNENLSISKTGKHHMMALQCAKLSDSGEYSIIARNVRKELKVIVQALFKRSLEKKTVMEGLEVTFECETEQAFPVIWYKDNKEINPSSNLKLMTLKTVHKLTILQTTLENKGKYEIKINNISSHADLDVKEMPDAIKQMSDHDRSVFLEAAKIGIAVRYNIRIIIVGKHGVGKTSLLRRLMNEDIEGVRSTDGINIEVKKCKINVHTKEWIFTKDKDSSLSKYPNEQYADCGFWDFAGQKEFYATHQTFLSRNAIYLLVVDVSEDFEKNTFGDMIKNQFENTGDYIDFWLDNIHCYTVNDRDEFMTLETNVLSPPVIIVGTGIDKVQDREKAKSKFKTFINKLLVEHPKRKHLRNLCFLSNTEPSEDKMEFQTLRNDIFDNANEIPKWGDNLPTRWILLEKEIERLIDQAEFVISYDMAKDLAAKCSFSVEEVTLELDSFLKYEHEIGNLIFFEDINSYIILEPKWLVDVFRCFVAPFQFQSQFMNMPEWSRLESTGNLPDCLIEKLFTKVQMHSNHKAFALLIMEKFDIIVKPITMEKNEEYYMPCMIAASGFKEILDTFNVRPDKCSRTSWFGLQFDFLPPAFFNHILVTFLTKYSLCIVGKARLAIYRGIGVFDLEASYCQKLVVCLSENSVAMQVWQFENGEGLCYQKERKYLTKIVDFLQKKYRIRIHYKCYLKCPDETHDNIGGETYLNDVPKKLQTFCREHSFHKVEDLRRFWYEEEEDTIVHQKGNTPVQCLHCEKMPVSKCYECCDVLCDECCLQHEKSYKYHTFQSINDKLLLTKKFAFPRMIIDIKTLPGGLLVIALYGVDKLFTFSIIDDEQNEINVGGRPCGIAKLDKNTIVVLFSHRSEEVDSVKIVDIRHRQVVQHEKVTLYIPPRFLCPMFYIDDKLYINSHSGITVTDISGTKDREIDLGFSPRDVCYDTKAARIYCIDDSGKKLICFERDENTIHTIPDPCLTNLKRLTIAREGDVLILSHEDYEITNFKVHKISWDGTSGETIITGKTNNKSSSEYKYSKICCDEDSDSVVIGLGATVYIYETN